MKKILFPSALFILSACNFNSPAQTDSTGTPADSAAREINSPYPVSYSAKFVPGNPKNADKILTLWKDYDNGTLSTHKEFFADSVHVYLAEGNILFTSRDSILSFMQQYRNSLQAVASRVDAVTSLRSTDQNEDWVTIWGSENDTQKSGMIDSVNLMETWRLNKAGKADLLYQYKMKILPRK